MTVAATTYDDNHWLHRIGITQNDGRVGAGINSNEKRPRYYHTAIHYKLLQIDKFFFVFFSFLFSSHISCIVLCIQFYDDIYMECCCPLGHVKYTDFFCSWSRICVSMCASPHVVNNTYTRWNVFFQFPIVLFGIIKLGFLHTCSAAVAGRILPHELFFLLLSTKRDPKRKEILLSRYGWCWTVNGVGGIDLYNVRID